MRLDLRFFREVSTRPQGRRRHQAIGIIVLATFISAYEGQLAPILSLLLPELGLSPQTYGTLTAAAVLVGAVSGLIGGRLVDKFGRVRLLVPFLALSGVACLLMASASDATQFAVARVLLSMVEGVAGAATAPLIRDYIPSTGRARAYAFWSWGPIGANMSAAAIAAVTLPHFGYSWRSQLVIMGLAGLLGASVVALVLRDLTPGLRSRPLTSAQVEGPTRLRVAARHPNRHTIGMHIAAMALLYIPFATINTYGPLILETEIGLSVEGASWLIALFWTANLIGCLAVAHRSDRNSRRRPYLLANGIGASAACLALAVAVNTPPSPPHAILTGLSIGALILLGCCLGGISGTWMATLTEQIETTYPQRPGTVFGIHHMVSRCLVLVTVLTAPLVAAAMGWGTWVLTLAPATVAFTLLINWATAQRTVNAPGYVNSPT